MASEQSMSFGAVWDTVRQWPADDRRSLASQILASLSGESGVKGEAAKARPSDLIGAWRDADSLDDAAASAVIEDALIEKHH